MSEAATVHWFPEVSMHAIRSGRTIEHRGVDRKFESLENAVRFVMEDLPEGARNTSLIQTDSAYEGPYIEALYSELKRP